MMNNICSKCGSNLEVDTSVRGGGSPSPGSISICFHCAQVCVFEKDLSLRKLPPEELQLLRSQDPEAWLIIAKIVEGIRRKIVLN